MLITPHLSQKELQLLLLLGGGQHALIVHKAGHYGFGKAVENRSEGCCTWRTKAEVTKWHTHIQERRRKHSIPF